MRLPLALIVICCATLGCRKRASPPPSSNDGGAEHTRDAGATAPDASQRDGGDAPPSPSVDSALASAVGSTSERDSGVAPGPSSAATPDATPVVPANSLDSGEVDGGNMGGDARDGGEPLGASDASSVCVPNNKRCSGQTTEVCDADSIWRPLVTCEAPLQCSAGECLAGLSYPCPLLPTLAHFEGVVPVVDGDGSEFSAVPEVTYQLRDAPVLSATYAAALPTRVTVRAAWSERAFYAHVHVEDPAVQTYQGSTLEYHWQGDNVQFFIAPTSLLTGKYSGTEDGHAIHLVVVPPSQGQPARAIEIYEPCYACVDAFFSSVSYAARVVDDGYEVELAWPWTAPEGVLASGDRVALNLVVGASDTLGAGLELEGSFANNPVEGESPCGGTPHPGCDDRTWCYSTLE